MPSLRVCLYYLDRKLKRRKRVVLAITVYCESEKKLWLKQIGKDIVSGKIELIFSFISNVFDVPHVLKTCKVSFAN